MTGRQSLPTLDKDSLIELYINKHMRLVDVAKKLNVSDTTIKRDLKKHGISVRKKGYGFNVKPEIVLSQTQYEFFDGLMISDGSICIHSNTKGRKSIGNGHLSCGFKYEEFAKYIVKFLNLGADVKLYVHKSERYISGECSQFKFYSESNVFFTKERDRWYPGGIKIIPADFRLSPVSMNIMYLSDGWLLKSDKTYRSARLCTQSFDKNNIEILIRKFAEIGIIANIASDRQITMNTENTIKFLEYIGECPVDCYKYKWSI